MERVLALVRKLIEYGRELAATVHQRAAADRHFAISGFGTHDIALVVAMITRGLNRAIALEARIIQLSQRPPARPRPARQASPRKPRPPAAALGQFPTAEEIATEVRRRPIGAVIADICSDLGIRCNHPLWREIQLALLRYGGNFVGLLKTIFDRTGASIMAAAEWETQSIAPPVPSPAGTGPP